jgi:hypothetical protein
LHCPGCGKDFKFPVHLLAANIRCNQCQTVFVPLDLTLYHAATRNAEVMQLRSFCGSGFYAVGFECEFGQFTVVLGSKFNVDLSENLDEGSITFRERLVKHQALVMDDDSRHYTLTRDVLFDSPSQAACIVAGRNEEGSTAWGLNCDTSSIEDRLLEDADTLDEEIGDPMILEIFETKSPKEEIHNLSNVQACRLIVAILEKRPNNSIKRDSLASEILRQLRVKTWGGPKEQFTRQIISQLRILTRIGITVEYISKNRRVKLTDNYREILESYLSKQEARAKRTKPAGGYRNPKAAKAEDASHTSVATLELWGADEGYPEDAHNSGDGDIDSFSDSEELNLTSGTLNLWDTEEALDDDGLMTSNHRDPGSREATSLLAAIDKITGGVPLASVNPATEEIAQLSTEDLIGHGLLEKIQASFESHRNVSSVRGWTQLTLQIQHDNQTIRVHLYLDSQTAQLRVRGYLPIVESTLGSLLRQSHQYDYVGALSIGHYEQREYLVITHRIHAGKFSVAEAIGQINDVISHCIAVGAFIGNHE